MSEVINNKDEEQYEIDLGDGEKAFLAYSERNDRMILTHTDVPQSHEGQGLGGKLVKAAADDARRRGVLVVPQCSFARAWFGRHAEEEDVLAKPRLD